MSIKLFKQAYANQIDLEAKKFKSELHMEAFLIENPDILGISDINSRVEVIKTQIHMKEARQDSDGRLDMLIYIDGGNIKEEYLAIVELKNGLLVTDHLSQLKEYLKCLNNPDNKSKIFNSNQIDPIYKNKNLIGILIGSDIDPNLKADFLDGKTEVEGIEIIGMTLTRFIAKKANESYIISETFTKSKSYFNKIRFNTWDEYEGNQIKNGGNKETLLIAKNFIDYFKNKLDIDDEDINYTNKDFTLNNPEGKKVKVFAYGGLGKSALTIYFTHLQGKPDLNIVERISDRYPNQYKVALKKIEDFTDEIKELIEISYNDILKK